MNPLLFRATSWIRGTLPSAGAEALALAVILLIPFKASVAQDGGPAAPPPVQMGRASGPTGSVTGRVICSDTQRPARFAQVQLQSVQSAAAPSSGTLGSGNGNGFFGGGGASARTGADGNFTMIGVAPGDYYVTATAPGYVPERLLVESEVAAGADPADVLVRIPQVRVTADSSASVTVAMERGASISGRVLWEDGSPASGVQMSASLNAPQGLPSAVARIQSPRSFQGTATDDRGMFRLTGLPPGSYTLQATVQADFPQFGRGRGFSPPRVIQVYAPGVFHRADAKPFVIRAAEDRTDARMTIDLTALRTVGGHVGVTGGGTVASGRVSLTDPNDSSFNVRTNILPDGTFRMTYVPPGTYTLQVSGASSQPGYGGGGRGGSSSGPATSFGPLSQQVMVRDGDLTDLDLNLAPNTTAAAQ